MAEDTFEVLEDKVRRAAGLVKRLREENQALQEELSRARGRAESAERRAETAAKKGSGPSAEQLRELQALGDEVKALREEREEVRRRITRLVDALEGLE
jgi:predicted RNase H-like nuclease (RuvC/YqgF family)